VKQLQSFAAVMGAQLLVTAVTYLYYGGLTRWLDIDDFARYAAFTAVFTVYTVIGLSITQSAARATARGTDRTSLERGVQRLTLVGAALAAVGAWPLQLLADIPLLWVLALAICTPVYARLSVRRGIFLGEAKPGALALSFFLEHGAKLLLTLPLALLMPAVDAAALSVALGLLFAFVAQPAPRHVRSILFQAQPERDTVSDTLRFGAFTLAQLLSANADVLLAHALLPDPEAAGLYAAAALGARFVLIGASAAQSASFAALCAPATERRSGLMLYGTILTGSVTFVALALLFGERALRTGFGAQYASAAELLPWLGVGAAAFSLAYARLQHHLARGQETTLGLGFVGIALQIVALLIWHGSALEFAWAQCAAGLFFAAFVWVGMPYIASQKKSAGDGFGSANLMDQPAMEGQPQKRSSDVIPSL
jgi:Polysaccharide biosynthesis protein